MAKIVTKGDVSLEKMEKNSRKSKKHKTNDLSNVDDEVIDGFQEVRGHRHRVKCKSELSESEYKARHEKNKLEDGQFLKKRDKKKRKRESSEYNHPSMSIEKAHNEDKEQGTNDGSAENLKPNKEKKRKHKRKGQQRNGDSDGISEGEKRGHDEVVDGNGTLTTGITLMKSNLVGADEKSTQRQEKKKDDKVKKKNRDGKASDISREDGERREKKKDAKGKKKTSDGKASDFLREDGESETAEKFDKKKKKKKKKKKTDGQKSDPEIRGESNTQSTPESPNNEGSESGKSKKKKTKSDENDYDKPKAKGKSKKVSFSSHVEVFPPSDVHPEIHKSMEDGLVRGKRFTQEEDAKIKEAVMNYIREHDLGEDGLKKVLNCSAHGITNCWKEIATCIPYRPYSAVYYRAHILFERAENRAWTPEEIELLKKLHEKHGNNWKMVSQELGKHRFHVKDAWRRIKLGNKTGQWSQEEYQTLYDLVNLDLQLKVVGSQEKKSKYGMLRDNIPWSAVSDKLSTRSDAACCLKWYNQLTSSLVAEKKWSDADDYRLIGALYDLDATCAEDVDWDNLLEHRSGDVCRKRWDQMVLHIGHHGSKPFAEQVETLAERYRPDLAETREAWDKKSVVP